MNRTNQPDRTPPRRPNNPDRPEARRVVVTSLDDLEDRAWKDQAWREFSRVDAYYDLDRDSA
jgi:hypothetical protein